MVCLRHQVLALFYYSKWDAILTQHLAGLPPIAATAAHHHVVFHAHSFFALPVQAVLLWPLTIRQQTSNHGSVKGHQCQAGSDEENGKQFAGGMQRFYFAKAYGACCDYLHVQRFQPAEPVGDDDITHRANNGEARQQQHRRSKAFEQRPLAKLAGQSGGVMRFFGRLGALNVSACMQKPYELRHLFWISLLLWACSTTRRTQQAATPLQQLLTDSALLQAHVGVLVVAAEEGRTLAAHNEQRYFVPASNTKLFTLFAGLRFLGDSLPAAELAEPAPGQLLLRSTGDPTFLHPDYARQPLAEVVRRYPQVYWQNAALRTTPYGNGWSWNDYDAPYMAPRSSMPMFGNVVDFSVQAGQLRVQPAAARVLVANADAIIDSGFDVRRRFDDAQFSIIPGRNRRLSSTLYLPAEQAAQLAATHFGNLWRTSSVPHYTGPWRRLYSQPTDSMLKPMMHRSDNFFAEQTLLMISQQLWGYMDENRVIDSLLRSDLRGLPQPPRWVDGSGLSRYNLFSPADMVWLLQALRTRFGMPRLQQLLPTGNTGTLRNYYTTLEGKIFAKTGTLAGVVALSGYLYAASGKLLQFSVLVNNHNGSATAVRRAVERYLMAVAAAQ